MTVTIHFRPHHFLCSLGFEGHGYSDTFTRNMEAIVVGTLRAKAGRSCKIEVVDTTDDICDPCPKRRNALCVDQDKIARLDRAHSNALDISFGDQLTWGDALARIKEHVKPGDLDEICAGCRWLELGACKAAVSRLHDAPLQATASGETPLL